MKEYITIRKIDYAKINSYQLIKTNYKVKDVDMLKVECEIKYSCSYLGSPAGGGSKMFTVYDDVEVSDVAWLKNIHLKLEEYRATIKREVAGWPEE